MADSQPEKKSTVSDPAKSKRSGKAKRPEAPDTEADKVVALPRRGRGRPRKGKEINRDLPRDEEILRIAAEVLYKKGLDGARLDDIAREAGIVKGSIYHYFSSKEEIYERLVENVRGRIDLEQEVKGSAPAQERLDHLLRTRLETTVEYPLEIALLVRELVRMEGPVGDWAREDPKRYFKAIRQIIIQGQKEGTFRPVDPDIMASVILGVLANLPNWYRLGGRIAPEALVDEITDFVMYGLGATPKD